MKSQFISRLAMVLMTGLASACLEESDYEKQQKASDVKIRKYLTDNSIEATEIVDGIYYETLISNSRGQSPKVGEIMIVNYDIKTLEGKAIETKTDSVTMFKFDINRIVPSGINYGIDVMKKGERIRMYLPWYHAYDNYQPDEGLFQAYTNFIVEVTLIDIKDEEAMLVSEIDSIEAYISQNEIADVIESSSGLYFKTLEAGDGPEVKSYSVIKLHYTRKHLDGTIIQETPDNEPLITDIHSGRLVEGFAEGVLKMREGEKALLIMPSDLAFGGSVQVIPQSLRSELFENRYITTLVPPYSPVIYEVEVLEVD